VKPEEHEEEGEVRRREKKGGKDNMSVRGEREGGGGK
jgi:hypothetical protein